MGPGKPGKSWNFIMAFPGLESPGNLFNSAKKICSVWKAVRRINIEILGLHWLMRILEPLKNQSESWKSPGITRW